jgi:isoleucyl-tRNA synthetase
VLARVVEAYRKIRNVLRVLTANLYDFDPRSHLVPRTSMEEIDRWAMARYADCAERIVRAYDDYDYPAIYQLANSLITVDLSAFYVDVTKDRMYTFGAASQARRSGQTAMYLIADGLARLLAPILSITMDELWRTLPGVREPSVHLTRFPQDLAEWRNEALVARWAALGAVRNQVNVALEEKRQEKLIAANLSARVRLSAGGETAELLAKYEAFLPTLFGVSQVTVAGPGPSRSPGPDAATLRAAVERADGVKCERCWRYVPEVSDREAFRGLCPRCVDALAEPVNR